MLARFFYRSEPISFISLMLLIVVWVTGSKAVNHDTWLDTAGTLLLFIMLLFLINFVIEKYRLTPVNYYAVYFFTILLGIFPKVLQLNKIALSSLLIVLVTQRVLRLKKKEHISYRLLDAGFLMGISYLIFPISAVYFLFIYIGYFLYIKIIDKRLFIPIIGFFIPVFLTFTYLYFFDKTNVFDNLTELNIPTNFSWIYKYTFSIPLLVLVLSLVFFILKIISLDTLSNLDEERNYKLSIAHFGLSGFVVMLTGLRAEESVLFLFFSASVLMGNALNRSKKWWFKEVVFYGLLATAVALFVL